MSAQTDIEKLLDANAFEILKEYFERQGQKDEACVAKKAKDGLSATPPTAKITIAEDGGGFRYSVKIELSEFVLLFNKSLTESNFLSAIRKYIKQKKPLWDGNVISKVMIVFT